MKPNDDPVEHRKVRFRGNSAGRQACLASQRDVGEVLAETFAAGVIEGVADYLAATVGLDRAHEAVRQVCERLDPHPAQRQDG